MEKFHLVDIESVRHSIPDWDSGYVRQLFDFGALLNQGEMQRSALVDSKLGIFLGFDAALAALIVGMSPSVAAWHAQVALMIALAAFFLSAISATFGLWITRCDSPSEIDWFCPEVKKGATELTRAHVVYLLDWHQNQLKFNGRKIGPAAIAQSAFGVGTFLTAIAAFVNISRL